MKSIPNKCPDSGCCHNNCADGNCMRVHYCGPLSNVFRHDVWPAHLTFDLELHDGHQIMTKLKSSISDK
jgi:hypothetical protein